MITTKMFMLQHVCSVPLASAIHPRFFTVSASTTITPSRNLTVSFPSSRVSHVDPRVLLGMSEQYLQQLAVDFGQQSYRGKQLHHLIYKRKEKEIQDFSHLPQAFRNDLMEAGWRIGRAPIYHTVTAADGTVKLLTKLEDNRLIETVGIPVEDEKGLMRLTACVSSQVGCPLHCSFCATGKGGYSRNLQWHEIIEQVLAVEDIF